MTRYVTIVGTGRDEYPRVDLARFATDLCAVMHGTAPRENRSGRDSWSFDLGDNELILSVPWHKGRATARIWARDIPGRDSQAARRFSTQEATFDPDARDLPRIAADITRRVIDASAEALASQRAEVMWRDARRAEMETLAATLEAKGMTVCRCEEDTELRFHGPGLGFSGRTEAGSQDAGRFTQIRFEHFTVPAQKALAVVDAVRG